MILLIAVSAFAFNTRKFYRQIQITGGDIMTYVNTASPANDADFLLTVTDVTASETISTATSVPALIRVSTQAGPTGTVAWVMFDAQAFATLGNVPAGRVFNLSLTYLGNADPVTNTVTTTITAPSGAAAVWLYGDANSWFLPLNMFGAPITHTLAVTANYVAEIYLNGSTTGHFTPYTFDPADAGIYTVVRNYTTWNPVDYNYDGSSNQSVNFVGTATPLAPINPIPANAAVIERAFGAPAAPVALSWEWDATQAIAPDSYNIYWPADAVAPINQVSSSWATPAIGFGAYTWKVEAVWNDPAKSSAAPLKVIFGTKTADVKGTGAAATWAFTITELPPPTTTYTLNVNGPDGYAVTGPVAGTTDYVATDNNDMVNDLVGSYTIAAVTAPSYWAVNPIEVTAADFDAVTHIANINFELITVNPVDPTSFPAYPAGNVTGFIVTGTGTHDLYIARQAGEIGALAYINSAWIAPDGAPDWTWTGVNFDAKAPIPVVVYGPTLPVELSSFTGTMTAEYFVQLNWTSQSETSLLGYRVLRGETADVNSAVSITPTLVTATNTSTTQNYSITDTEVENNTTYSYWLESVNMDGTSEFHGPVNVLVQHEVPPVLPEYTSMRNAYPNPFAQNSSTNLEVSVKAGETGTVTIYNILGQVVKTYTVREGLNNLNWNGKDSKGNTCGSGIYFYRLSTPSMNQTKKMVIVK